jgi:hypothetical protein
MAADDDDDVSDDERLIIGEADDMGELLNVFKFL